MTGHNEQRQHEPAGTRRTEIDMLLRRAYRGIRGAGIGQLAPLPFKPYVYRDGDDERERQVLEEVARIQAEARRRRSEARRRAGLPEEGDPA